MKELSTSLSERDRQVRRFLGELLDADSMSVEVGEAAGEAVDSESSSEHPRRELRPYLSASPCSDVPVFGAEDTGEPLLIRTPRLRSDAAIPFAGAAGYLISETLGERLVIALDRTGHLSFVKAVGEVESQRIFDECQRIPEGSRFQVRQLGTAESVRGETVEADGAGETMSQPVHVLEADPVDSTDPILSDHPVDNKHNVTDDNSTHWRVD